ncbi:DUF4240 domain-containing protein [Nocardia heshunensis]
MTHEKFWALIATIDGRASRHSCRRLSRYLASRPVTEIAGFAELLSEALYWLDQECFGLQPVIDTATSRRVGTQSGESFLRARCAVVAAGREVYSSMFDRPVMFARYTALDGQCLLSIVPEAFRERTGLNWSRQTWLSFESYSNDSGWSGRFRKTPRYPQFCRL